MKIKIKYHNPKCKLEIIKKGEWIDLKAAESLEAPHGAFNLVSLGVSMCLPKDFEAIVAPRSSSLKKFGFTQTNSIGIIDSSYCGNEDIWRLPIYTIGNTTLIMEGDRICQFRIQPSQKASVWTKIKWLFTNKIKFIEVDNLEASNRGGFGSTGK